MENSPEDLQLKTWQGEFGDAYTQRNQVDWRVRVPAFETMLKGLSIDSILEVGCNRGHNLKALVQVLSTDSRVCGVEPNGSARQLATDSCPAAQVVEGNAESLPFADGEFDLVFTAGVLIHVPPTTFDVALSEIHRVSGRYLLAIEYFAEKETPIVYRGQDDLLFKRDFWAEYRSRFPGLQLVRDGFWAAGDGFDDCHWWLVEKPAPSSGSR